MNKAVGQTLNYLRELDEERNTIRQKPGIECRRASATVVIGDPQVRLRECAAAAVATT